QTYQTVRSERDRLAGSLPQQQQLLAELQRQIADLKALAAQRDTALEERKQRDRIKRFVNFARKAYKEAGPRITERYVQQISREGDRLFRELLNRPNVALTWTRDYEILVQEGPNTRRFVNLSGGEQMCAALAVRLALLKVLADIDIAFFDEPTTNMDRPRRESLAEAIARIRSFKQLFVISHDDTFEKVTENVIVVEREG
ncbi:MAG: SMC family ATPase, partial [Cyanobacteria bacterium P01_D01_bin.115]